MWNRSRSTCLYFLNSAASGVSSAMRIGEWIQGFPESGFSHQWAGPRSQGHAPNDPGLPGSQHPKVLNIHCACNAQFWGFWGEVEPGPRTLYIRTVRRARGTNCLFEDDPLSVPLLHLVTSYQHVALFAVSCARGNHHVKASLASRTGRSTHVRPFLRKCQEAREVGRGAKMRCSGAGPCGTRSGRARDVAPPATWCRGCSSVPHLVLGL